MEVRHPDLSIDDIEETGRCQKQREEVWYDCKDGGLRVSARVSVEYFPPRASEVYAPRSRSARGEAALLEAAGVGMALVETSFGQPVWVDGTLPGPMAEKRPARPS